jgi:hypothetical protein
MPKLKGIFKTLPVILKEGRRPRSPKWWKDLRKRVLFRDRYECQMCHKKSNYLEVHHINSLFSGGTHEMKNLISLCKSCHRKLQRLDFLSSFDDSTPGEKKLEREEELKCIRERRNVWWGPTWKDVPDIIGVLHKGWGNNSRPFGY